MKRLYNLNFAFDKPNFVGNCNNAYLNAVKHCLGIYETTLCSLNVALKLINFVQPIVYNLCTTFCAWIQWRCNYLYIVYEFIYLFIYLFIYSFIYLCIYLWIYLCIIYFGSLQFLSIIESVNEYFVHQIGEYLCTLFF